MNFIEATSFMYEELIEATSSGAHRSLHSLTKLNKIAMKRPASSAKASDHLPKSGRYLVSLAWSIFAFAGKKKEKREGKERKRRKREEEEGVIYYFALTS